MTQMWIDEQEGYKVGDVGFLICNYNENTGSERWFLRDNPAHTNRSNVPRMLGWCGSYNNVSTSGCGVWKVIRIARSGRYLIEKATPDEVEVFLEEVGYPDLTEDD